MYSPLFVQRHCMESFMFSCRLTPCIFSHKTTYSCISCAVWWDNMCEIHRLSCIAFWTEIFFLFAFWNNVGARLLAVVPLIQDDVQNCAVFPYPNVTAIEAAKSSQSRLSHDSSSSFQAWSLCFHWNQSHRNLSAFAKRSSSRIPSPPFPLGQQVVGQFTKECPP